MTLKDVKTSWITKEKIPLVIKPIQPDWTKEQFIDWLKNNKTLLEDKILAHGGLLFRDFPILGPTDFSDSIAALGLGNPLNYIGGDSPRDKVQGQVYTSTEAPKRMLLPLHNEMSFIRDYPKHIYFHCQIAAKRGGATILANARAVLASVDKRVRDKFEAHGLRYVSNYYEYSLVHETINKFQRGHKSWKEVFETNCRKQVESLCQASGFEFSWNKRGWLQIAQRAPATLLHPKTQEKVWFNQAHLYDFNPRLLGFFNWLGAQLVYANAKTRLHEIYYGNGEKIAKRDLYHVMDVLEKNTISYPWQQGDFLVLDNVLIMHGRAPFEGPRKILTALTSPR